MSNQNENYPWVIRTDFSDDQAWIMVKRLIAAPQTDALSGLEFTANVRFIEQPAFANSPPLEAVRALPADYPGFVVFVVDTETIESKEHSIQVIGFSPQSDNSTDFERQPSETPLAEIKIFRAIPSALQAVENNLSIANMDFEDFAKSVDRDGIFRGFAS